MKRLLFCVALLLSALVGESNAQWGGGGGYSNYYNFNRGLYADFDRMPYFALHPPVYYSYPVPRTYGYSPFAYPGHVRTPQLQTSEPAVLLNPYMEGEPTPAGQPKSPATAPTVKPKKTGSSSLSRPSDDKLGNVTPLRIANPFFEPRQVVSGR